MLLLTISSRNSYIVVLLKAARTAIRSGSPAGSPPRYRLEPPARVLPPFWKATQVVISIGPIVLRFDGDQTGEQCSAGLAYPWWDLSDMHAMALTARGARLTPLDRPDPIPGPGEVRV